MKPETIPQRSVRTGSRPSRESLPPSESNRRVIESRISEEPNGNGANGKNGVHGTTVIPLHNGDHNGNGHTPVPLSSSESIQLSASVVRALNGNGAVAVEKLRDRTIPHNNGNGRPGKNDFHRADGSGGVATLFEALPLPNGNGSAAIAEPLSGADFAETVHPNTDGFYQRVGKRALDIAGALFGLAVFGPVMLLFAAIVKATSRGPVIYRSTRVGQDGQHFTFYKFRSMYVGADRDRVNLLHLNEKDGPVFKLRRDPRTTPVGRFMRTTSIDEMPQFYNVLKGEMSLVGPRPPIPEEVEKYEPWQQRRLEVKPGLTCLWQISGRCRLSFDEWMRLDLQYIKHQSFWTDVKILARTLPAVISREGAY